MFAKKESRDVARSNAKKDVKGDESHLEIGKMTVSVFYRCDIVAQVTRVLYICNSCPSQDVDVEAFLGSLAHQASKFYCSLMFNGTCSRKHFPFGTCIYNPTSLMRVLEHLLHHPNCCAEKATGDPSSPSGTGPVQLVATSPKATRLKDVRTWQPQVPRWGGLEVCRIEVLVLVSNFEMCWSLE